MLRVGIYRPRWRAEGRVCPQARFMDDYIYQRRGYHSARLLQRLWKASNYNE